MRRPRRLAASGIKLGRRGCVARQRAWRRGSLAVSVLVVHRWCAFRHQARHPGGLAVSSRGGSRGASLGLLALPHLHAPVPALLCWGPSRLSPFWNGLTLRPLVHRGRLRQWSQPPALPCSLSQCCSTCGPCGGAVAMSLALTRAAEGHPPRDRPVPAPGLLRDGQDWDSGC